MQTIRGLIVYFVVVHNLYLLNVHIDGLELYMFLMRFILTFGLIFVSLIRFVERKSEIILNVLLIAFLLVLNNLDHNVFFEWSTSFLYYCAIAIYLMLPKTQSDVLVLPYKISFLKAAIILSNSILVVFPDVLSAKNTEINLVGWFYISSLLALFSVESLVRISVTYVSIFMSSVIPLLFLVAGFHNIFKGNMEYDIIMVVVSITSLGICGFMAYGRRLNA